MKGIVEEFCKDCSEPQNLRYSASADDFTVFDWETGEKLKGYEIITRLNRQNSLLRVCNKHRNALIEALNEEKDKADGELKKALIRICNKELDI